MKIFFRCAAFAPLVALVAGCCANNTCNCDDLQADSLYLVLKDAPSAGVANDTTYFTAAQLDTVYLQRYATAKPAQPATATTPAIAAQPEGALSAPITIIRAQQANVNSALLRKLTRANLPNTTLVISNNTPFAPGTTGGKLDAFNYLLTVQDRSVRAPRRLYTFTVKNIALQGQYAGDGCCTCYENTQKQFQLVGRATRTINVTESGSAGTKSPVPVIISKLD